MLSRTQEYPMNHVKTVRTIIEAFKAGDIDLVLSHVADDVDWEYGSVVDVPWYTPRKGKMEAAKFFQALQAVAVPAVRAEELCRGGRRGGGAARLGLPREEQRAASRLTKICSSCSASMQKERWRGSRIASNAPGRRAYHGTAPVLGRNEFSRRGRCRPGTRPGPDRQAAWPLAAPHLCAEGATRRWTSRWSGAQGCARRGVPRRSSREGS